MTSSFLPYGQHVLDEDDIRAVTELMRSGAMLTSGPEAALLERELAAYIGVDHAVICSNGTTALHLAALAAELGPGDLAIVPTITFLSTANVVRMCGADVVFADVDPETGLMEMEHFESALKKADGSVKAVFPVHLNGQCGNIAEIYNFAAKKGISVCKSLCEVRLLLRNAV